MAKRPRYSKGPKKGKFMSNRAIAYAKTARAKKRGPKKKKKKAAKKATTKRKNPVAKKSKKRRRSTGNKSVMSGKYKGEVFGAGVGMGYVEQMPNSVLQSVPTIESLGFDGTMAIGMHFIAKSMGRGAFSKWLDRAATAYAGSAGLEFGRGGLKMTGDDLAGDDGRPAVIAGSVRYDQRTDGLEHGS